MPKAEREGQIILSACSESQKVNIHNLFSDYTFAIIKTLFNKKNKDEELSYNALHTEICDYLEDRRDYGVPQPTTQYLSGIEGNFLDFTDKVINSVHKKIIKIYQQRPNSVKMIANPVFTDPQDEDIARFLLECQDHFYMFFLPLLYLPPGSEPVKNKEGKSFRGIPESVLKKIGHLVDCFVSFYEKGKYSLYDSNLQNPNLVYENLLFCAYFYFFRETWEKAKRLHIIILENKPTQFDFVFSEAEIHFQYGSVLLQLARLANDYSNIHSVIDQYDIVLEMNTNDRCRAKTLYNLSQASRYNKEYEDALSAIDDSEKHYRKIMKEEEVVLFESVLNESIIVRLFCAREIGTTQEREMYLIEAGEKLRELNQVKDGFTDEWHYLAIIYYLKIQINPIKRKFYEKKIIEVLNKANTCGINIKKNLREEKLFPLISKEIWRLWQSK
jgi:hypothetical protein